MTYTADTQHATVTYIDEVTGEQLSVDQIDGDSNTKSNYTTDAKIADYEKQGYKFASSNFPDDGLTFDTDDDKSQDYTVKFTHDTTKTDTPQTPGTPIDPKNPNGPKWPDEVTKDKLTKAVNETIHYVYAGGAKAADDKTDKVSFSRTATVDAVTGKFIAYGEWTADDNDTTFDAVKSPVIAGYTANGDVAAVTGLTADHEDVTATVTYTADTQHATVTYIDEVTGEHLSVDHIDGDSNTKSNYTTDTKIKDYEKQGYKFASSNFPDDGLTFDTDDDKSQDYTVKFTHDTTKTDTPQTPGTPIDPKNPNGPKWPDEVTKDKLTKAVNETIHYVYAGGAKAADDKTDKVSFSRTATVDAVTGKFIAYGEWTADDNDTTFDAVTSPVIAGYTANGDVPAFTGLTADHEDINETVTYTADDQKVVYNVIDDTTGETLVSKKLFDEGVTAGELKKTKADLQTIANDFVKQGYDIVSVGDVPGVFDNDDKTDQVVDVHLKHRVDTVDPKTPGVPDQPINPEDPKSPKWPNEVIKDKLTKTVNETIHYVYAKGGTAADDKTDKVSFSRTATVDAVTGKFIAYGEWTADDNDTTFDAVESPVIAGYTASGDVPAFTGLTADHEDVTKTVTYTADDQKVVYNVIDDTTGKELVSKKLFDEGVTAGELKKTKADLQTIANDFVKQGYNVVLVDDVPATFDNDDDTDQVVNIHLTHTMKPVTVENQLDVKVTEIVHYVYQDGTTVAPDVTDTVEFTRTGIIDEATDVVTYTDWTAVNGDNSFDTKVSPVITGYVADKANVAEVDGLTSASKNVEKTVTYSKLGSYVPELPDGSTPSVPYPNDPTDPSKPGTDVPVMPHVPGYTPVGPDGKPLTPVDPQDPSKGYNPPAVPSDPTTDTVIKYGADKQNVVYNVINDTTGENLATNVLFDSGDTDAALTKGQADLQAIADAYIEQGYDVVSVDTVPGSFDDDDTVDQIVNIHLKNKTATAMVPNEPIRVVTAMVPNEPVYATPVVVPNGPVNVPTSVVTGDNTTRVGKAVTNTPTKLGATSGSSVVITRADDNAKAKNSVATSNTVSLPDTAAKGNQDENALLVALAVIASLLTFGFVQKRK
ncbi:MucBP domain protein [Streptococcus pneumoniae]|nr:MucBP domain protein [Streptococcus pneumoniae]